MSRLMSGLSPELFDKYLEIMRDETGGLEIECMRPARDKIPNLLGQFNTLKLLQAEQEYHHEELLIDYDGKFLELKTQLMDEGYKSTEAKEHAKDELREERLQIAGIEKDITLLKAQIHNIQYQLKLKYTELGQENKK